MFDRFKIYGILGFASSVSFEDVKPLLSAILAIILDFAYSFAKKKLRDFNNKK